MGFGPLIAGITNRILRQRLTVLLGRPHLARQATYDLRCLRRKGLIARLPGRHRYMVTPPRRRVAFLLVNTHGRVLTPGLMTLDPDLAADLASRDPLALARGRSDRALDQHIDRAMVAA